MGAMFSSMVNMQRDHRAFFFIIVVDQLDGEPPFANVAMAGNELFIALEAEFLVTAVGGLSR
jgi:hypothetical protein